MRLIYHKDGTLPTGSEIFVFGSNLAGRHGAGAAKVAHQKYGAKYGFGFGFSGRSYAIPTKDRYIKTLSLDVIRGYITDFITDVCNADHTEYFITGVGTGLAGYEIDQMAEIWFLEMQDLFTVPYLGPNIEFSFPNQFEKYFEKWYNNLYAN